MRCGNTGNNDVRAVIFINKTITGSLINAETRAEVECVFVAVPSRLSCGLLQKFRKSY